MHIGIAGCDADHESNIFLDQRVDGGRRTVDRGEVGFQCGKGSVCREDLAIATAGRGTAASTRGATPCGDTAVGCQRGEGPVGRENLAMATAGRSTAASTRGVPHAVMLPSGVNAAKAAEVAEISE